jgi:hypothetical protein
MKKYHQLLLLILLYITKLTTCQAETINTLDYFISKHPTQSLTGTHNTNQVITGNSSYYVKWSANVFEYHTWDDNYIYMREDHSGVPNPVYEFYPGLWMKRSTNIGEKIDMHNNIVQWYDSNGKIDHQAPFPYEMTLEAHNPSFDIGGDLGTQDVIILKYDYAVSYEKFYYSKDWGWVKWELYSSDNTLLQSSIFNLISGPIIVPTAPYVLTAPPAKLTTLSASSGINNGEISLSWNAPGDNGWLGPLLNGSDFDIQYSTELNTRDIVWSYSLSQIRVSTSSVIPGTEVNYTLTGLLTSSTYYIRIWHKDNLNNYSDISTGATVTITVNSPDSEIRQFSDPPFTDDISVSGKIYSYDPYLDNACVKKWNHQYTDGSQLAFVPATSSYVRGNWLNLALEGSTVKEIPWDYSEWKENTATVIYKQVGNQMMAGTALWSMSGKYDCIAFGQSYTDFLGPGIPADLSLSQDLNLTVKAYISNISTYSWSRAGLVFQFVDDIGFIRWAEFDFYDSTDIKPVAVNGIDYSCWGPAATNYGVREVYKAWGENVPLETWFVRTLNTSFVRRIWPELDPVKLKIESVYMVFEGNNAKGIFWVSDLVFYSQADTTPPTDIVTLNDNTLSGFPFAYPNPYKLSAANTAGGIVFSSLGASRTTICIFTLSGRLVREIEQDPVEGKINWNVKDKSNEKVPSGIYTYSATNLAGKKFSGKIAIIK